VENTYRIPEVQTRGLWLIYVPSDSAWGLLPSLWAEPPTFWLKVQSVPSSSTLRSLPVEQSGQSQADAQGCLSQVGDTHWPHAPIGQ
jgi:hypothetical protein